MKNARSFLAGCLCGAIAAGATASMAAKMVGSSGYLMGWTVEVDGEEVCSDPYVWDATREIECD